MSTLVLNRDSLSVKLEANHLVVHDHASGDAPRRMPLMDMDRVVIVGQPAISFRVLAHLMDRRIPCSFLTHCGGWRGLMDGDPGFHAGRRRRQYSLAADPGFALRLARQSISAKIANSRRTLQRLAAERHVSLADEKEWRLLSGLGGELSKVGMIDGVRGIEGMAATSYFRLLGTFFPEDAPFPRRSRRPPRDAANALLSFFYTLITGVFAAAIRSHGLDVSCGFFHRGGDRAPVLALDLMEPFRPAWVDRLVLDLLNHRRLRADDHFEECCEGGVHLSADGRRIAFKAFDEMMARRIDMGGVRLTLRQVVDREVCKFIGMIEGDEPIRFFRAA